VGVTALEARVVEIVVEAGDGEPIATVGLGGGLVGVLVGGSGGVLVGGGTGVLVGKGRAVAVGCGRGVGVGVGGATRVTLT